MNLVPCSQQADPCVLIYGCKCVEQLKKIECIELGLSNIPDPYRLSGYEYHILDFTNNQIKDITRRDMQKWSRFASMDLRGNPLSRSTCEVLEYFAMHSKRTVMSDCRCVYLQVNYVLFVYIDNMFVNC